MELRTLVEGGGTRRRGGPFATGLRALALFGLAAALALGPASVAAADTGSGSERTADTNASPDPECGSYRAHRVPQTFAGCTELQQRVEAIASFRGADGGFRLAEYERLLQEFFGRYCHRNDELGWVRDKAVRDTGPYVSRLGSDGTWAPPAYYGTHQPVVIWYNRLMIDWLHRYRPHGDEESEAAAVTEEGTIPDGAIMVKEMYPAPAARCAQYPPEHLEPSPEIGVALMIRDNEGAQDGWFWGAWWPAFEPDWPAKAGNGLPAMGFGAYCLNCHASARDHLTFADLENVEGEPGWPNVYVSQNFLFENQLGGAADSGRHRAVPDTSDDPAVLDDPLPAYSPAFLARFPEPDPPTADRVVAMPSETYDNVWVPAGGPTAGSEFVTSDQCIGCHDAGGTGLQFDMTEPSPADGKLLNLSPYATWRTSPMGLGGRDPIFFAQLASETETFHPDRSRLIQDVCLGCHGILGQRQFGIDSEAAAAVNGAEADVECAQFQRSQVNAVPYPSDPSHNPDLASAPYGALARDGISCTACHHMALTDERIHEVVGDPQNRCVEQRQALLNPDSRGFARTFTGSFYVGPPGELYGPFEDPKTKPMEHALDIQPIHDPAIRSSDVCGSCHTVHLPVYGEGGRELGFTYEQTTYPEWAFSAYRTGVTAGGDDLPLGPGDLAQSCQSCHMRSAGRDGRSFQSKIAGIQEYSNFPATDNTLAPDEIDLAVREGFARHTLVGLNVFFVEMAQQFPGVLGLRTQDPMLVSKGLDPALLTERRILEQATHDTAAVAVGEVDRDGDLLRARVTVTSDVGHKFPSGVGFRRAFLEVAVLDEEGGELWVSGRTDGAGTLVGAAGRPIAGELWWEPDCSRRLPGTPHQPHYQRISRQDQVQIYQELVTSPPVGVGDPRCGHDPVPGGQLTTSFLSICGHVKDNRVLPQGFLPEKDRVEIAEALGAGPELATDSGPRKVGDDPDYRRGGADSLIYEIDLSALEGDPAYLQATLYYQAIPPFYLQDRFCTSKSADTERLYYLAGNLDLEGGRAEDWKLEVVGSGRVPIR